MVDENNVGISREISSFSVTTSTIAITYDTRFLKLDVLTTGLRKGSMLDMHLLEYDKTELVDLGAGLSNELFTDH